MQCALLLVAGIFLFRAQQTDSDDRPTAQLMLIMLGFLMVANVLGIAHFHLTRRAARQAARDEHPAT